MAGTGIDLITAITRNAGLMAIDNCPGVPVEMGRALYARVQSDKGADKIKSSSSEKDIIQMIAFGGSPSDTAVWHFSSDSPTHHFVVIPWYRHTAPIGIVYAVFMAYENQYKFGEYLQGRRAAPTGDLGYKAARSIGELKTMLQDLVTSNTAWQDYFGQVGPARTMKLNCYKYPTLRVSTAIKNVNQHPRN